MTWIGFQKNRIVHVVLAIIVIAGLIWSNVTYDEYCNVCKKGINKGWQYNEVWLCDSCNDKVVYVTGGHWNIGQEGGGSLRFVEIWDKERWDWIYEWAK